jgi:hypothetical protein
MEVFVRRDSTRRSQRLIAARPREINDRGDV